MNLMAVDFELEYELFDLIQMSLNAFRFTWNLGFLFKAESKVVNRLNIIKGVKIRDWVKDNEWKYLYPFVFPVFY